MEEILSVFIQEARELADVNGRVQRRAVFQFADTVLIFDQSLDRSLGGGKKSRACAELLRQGRPGPVCYVV